MDSPGPVIARPLCACGCGMPTGIAKVTVPKYGYIKGQPFEYRRGHSPRTTKPEYVVSIAGCWEWQRSIGKDGYGRLSKHGRRQLAHRYVYERERPEIPDGFQLDHLCRNRRCVNPDHLEVVTSAENSRRGVNTKLTAADVTAIRASDDDARVVAMRHGITRSYVYNLRRGLYWENVA